MQYVVYGAGAVGGLIGSRLHQLGRPTTLIARGDHLTAMQRDGLVIETEHGRELIDVRAVASLPSSDWTDDTVVLLAVKSQHTHAALEDISRHAPPDVTIVTAQNGVANEREALRRFADVQAMSVFQPCARIEPGVIVQQSHPVPGILDLGCYPAGSTDTTVAIVADLRAAGFAAAARDDIMSWKYRKLIHNLGTAVQACYEPGAEADELTARARREGDAVLTAAGLPVITAEQDVERRADLLQGRARSDYLGSAWQSITRGHEIVETDWINGEIILLGREHRVPTPANELIRQAANLLARRHGRPQSLDPADALASLCGTVGQGNPSVTR